MAETENTENAEEIAGLPDAEGAETAHDAVEGAGAGDAAPAAEAPEAVSPAERRAQARTAEASSRPQRTAEERQAERDETRRRKAAARRVERTRERAKAKAASGDGAAQTTPPHEHGPGRPKTRQGVVVSDKASKTITVRIDVARRHRRYQKIVRTSTTLHAHDERGEAHVGDTVIVRECRPLSRTKHWRLVQVLERAE
jgi:small subunit ribosomal protein S17